MGATPDGVWHRNAHYWRKFIGGVHKIQILIRELLDDFLRNFFGEEIRGGARALRPLHLGKLDGLVYWAGLHKLRIVIRDLL